MRGLKSRQLVLHLAQGCLDVREFTFLARELLLQFTRTTEEE
jgi:hypothetical protein